MIIFDDFNKFRKILKMLFADFPNTKFRFPEVFSCYTWHITEIGGSESGIEISSAPN